MRLVLRLAIAIALAVLSTTALAQQQPPLTDFRPGGTYDPAVPRPDSVLGYAIGTHHTDYAGLERWLAALQRSDRVRVLRYGESVERRPLYLIVISSPANLARLEEVRAAMAKLADPRTTNDAEAQRIAASMPAVAWMNHANDGNESAAFESAIQTSYQLAAGTDSVTRRIIDQLVVIVNPAHNPESHERFVAWYNSAQVGAEGTADNNAIEHHAPWGMSTNNNHFQIDLNRDAFFGTQQETRAIVKAFGQWHPVVFVDHHGQTKNMFFPPPADAVNLNVTGNQTQWMDRYGSAIADAFDARGWSYYRRGRFDLFYAGFWDSWPTLNGSVGLTFETDAGGSKGLAWEREDGTILPLRDGIVRHHTGSMAVLRVTAEQKAQRLADFYAYRKSAIAEGEREAMKQVVLFAGNDAARAATLARTLAAQRIEVRRVDRPFTLQRAHGYFGGAAARREVPAGSYVVSMAQPQKRLARALLELEPAFTPEFLANERKKKERAELTGRRSRDGFYDATAWSLPLMFGVDAVWAEDAVPAGLSAPVADSIPTPAPAAPDGAARYGWLYDGTTLGGMRLTAQLLREGFNVAVATEPFSVQRRDFGRGAIVARTERNAATLRERIVALAAESGVALQSLEGARVERGADFGEDPIVELRRPRIAVVAGEPTDDRAFGATWFTLERRLGYPFTAIAIPQLLDARLADYDVIVLPHGAPSEWQEMLGEAGLARLRRWTQDGGTLVAMKGAAAMATREGVHWTSSTLKRQTANVRLFFDQPAGDSAALSRQMDLVRTAGAILRVKVDPEHFLGYGYSGDVGALVSSNYAFTISRDGANTAAFPEERSLRLAGWIWPEAQRALARTLYAWAEPAGRGQVILFADDPNFRAAQLSTLGMFFNAVILGPSFTR